MERIKVKQERCTGCFNTLSPLVHIKTIYFQDSISIPDYHAHFQNYNLIDLLPVFKFMCQGRAHFHEQFLPIFFGVAFQKWP